MHERINLDEAGEQIEEGRTAWVVSRIAAGGLTWRDTAGDWPVPLTTDGSAVQRSDSIEVVLRKGSRKGSVVLYSGRWADLFCRAGSPDAHLLDETRGWQDWLGVASFSRLMDRRTGLLDSPTVSGIVAHDVG